MPRSHIIKKAFAQYYSSANKIVQPSSTTSREFGFLLFDKNVMVRHQSFGSIERLKDALQRIVPSSAYYSTALYESPSNSRMDRKGWLGADLVFDIDADHIPTACKESHDPTWTCDTCLESAKRETIKLLDILQEDFGFNGDSIRIYFSGNRGYHVHVEHKDVSTLDSIARKEMADYVIGLGLEAQFHSFLGEHSVGWSRRLSAGFSEYIEKLNEKDRIRALRAGMKRKLQSTIVNQQAALIDTVVTTDVHRLIRLAGSLHGKTGLKKVEASLRKFEQFDPLKESVAFKKGEMIINVRQAPQFRIGDSYYGPFNEPTRQTLPTAAALFLLCKGAAEMSG